MKSPRSEVLICSYASGITGYCPAEWNDDKVLAADKAGRSWYLVTSRASLPSTFPSTKYCRIPSVSFKDWKSELELSSSQPPKKIDKAWGLIAGSVGRLFDSLFEFSAGSWSDGRYSWALTATPIIIFKTILLRPKFIFATGGPFSGPVAAAIAARVTRTPLITEFQDPVVGPQIQVSPQAQFALKLIEKFVISSSAQSFYVTKAASESAKTRYPRLSQKIAFQYPGSWPHSGPRSEPSLSSNQRLRIGHIGFLYGDRDLDYFFSALDMIRPGLNAGYSIEVTNVGGLTTALEAKYRTRTDFRRIDRLPRLEALQLAKQFDVLLLVQHRGNQADETIPYKTYDYANLGVPILALTKNPELRELILDIGGYVCDTTHLESIKVELDRVIADHLSGDLRQIELRKLDIVERWKAMEKALPDDVMVR